MAKPEKKSADLPFMLLMMAAMLTWGGSWISGKWAAAYPPQLIAFWRFLISILSFVPFILARKESIAIDLRTWLWLLPSAVAMLLYNIFFLSGLKTGGAGYAGVLVPTINPLFSFLIAFLFLGQKTTRIVFLGLGAGLAGGLLQILGAEMRWSAFLRPENLYLLSAALVYAALTHLSAQAQKRVSVYVYSFWLYVIGSVLMLPLAWQYRPWDFSNLGFVFWADTVYLALFTGTFGTTLYFVAAKRVGAARASSWAFLVPVTALVLSMILLGERASWTSLVGGALSFGAVLLIQLTKKPGVAQVR